MSKTLLSLDASSLTTYQAGLMQAQAYRALTRTFSSYLAAYDLTLSEWSLIGLLYEKSQLTHVAISCDLDVTPTMTTRLVSKLEGLGYLIRTTAVGDNRIKHVSITTSGRDVVEKIEPALRSRMRRLLGGIKPTDLSAYLGVLAYLADPESQAQNS